jgi:prolyl-tRNA editing enzyme YbaK/EbsC (Cys-tRNA(Pro) deacylase)
MPTVEDAAAVLGIHLSEMTKNVVFLIKGEPVLVIARGQARVDKGILARLVGVGKKQVKLATSAQTLELTGFAAGCVPPFGHKVPLRTFIDESVLGLERVYGGTSDPNILISLPLDGLFQLTGGTVIAAQAWDIGDHAGNT